jgi:hypothetical protein
VAIRAGDEAAEAEALERGMRASLHVVIAAASGLEDDFHG